MSDIHIRSISKSFGEKHVLRDCSLTVEEGKTTCLMGASGSGKTTLLRILLGLEQQDSGCITGLPEKISCVFQEDRLAEDFSAVSNIRFVTGKTRTRQQISEHLSQLGLGENAKLPVKKLSGGMKRRVALARALCCEWDLLILDEPFKGLDAALKQSVIEYVKKYTAGKTVLCVTHDASEVEALGGKLIEWKK